MSTSDLQESSKSSIDASASVSEPAGRRGFIGRLAAGAAAVVAGIAPARLLHAAAPDDSDLSNGVGSGDDWMRALRGKHRMAFDLGAHRNGRPLAQSKNYFDAWRDAFQAPESDVNLVLGIHGEAVPMVFTDALWSRYRIGELYDVTDAATKAPAVRNVFAEENVVANGPVTREQTVQALQRRGARFVLCMNAVAAASRKLAAAQLGTPEEIRTALLGGLLPGVITVPAMVVTFTQLQERGVKYMKVA